MTIDKDAMYGQYNESAGRRQNLKEDIVRKSLDLPADEDMNIDSKTGISGDELAKILDANKGSNVLGVFAIAMATCAAIGMMGAMIMPSQNSNQPPPQVSPVDSNYTVKFYNSAGEEIVIPQKNGQSIQP